MDKISIIMPNYNHGEHLKEAVESCLTQTYDNIELIITDNSTDNSMKILDEYKDDKRVSIFFRSGAWSLTQKLNFMLKEAKGEYIRLCYSDDVLRKDCIEKNVIFSKKFNLDFVKSDNNQIDYDGNILLRNDLRNRYNIKNNIVGRTDIKRIIKTSDAGPLCIDSPTLFGKTESFKEIGGWNETFILEDVLFVYYMNIFDFKIGFINKPLWNYRVFQKIDTNPVYSLITEEYFSMRIFCMNLAIKSGKLDKIAITIAKKRIKTYKAEIFQSKYKYLGLIWLFYNRYSPILVRNKLISDRKKFSIKNYIKFVRNDFWNRIKLVRENKRNPQTFY